MSRSPGPSRVTDRPAIRISPDVGLSRPASSRNAVLLPHPEGPTRIRNSPSATARSSPFSATTSPNARDAAELYLRHAAPLVESSIAHHQPFNPVPATDWTKYRCATTNTTSIGSRLITLPAISSGQFVEWAPWK